MIDRLHDALWQAGIPVRYIDGPQSAQANIVYEAQATAAQRTQGASILAGFDWSDAAHAPWQLAQEKAVASATLDAPANNDRLIRALALVVLDEINIVRARFTNPALPPRTVAQVIAAVKAKL